ncbi:hypothetical protein JTB14_030028 [Gonioctena quinquepunctata]|nr:hypothetical protein JTB14_030028 [Gonioctena quinquepunctata]
MDTLSLKCPLCCEETFSSHHSLKYHILSITDNLLCPACNMRFENILDLAEHLGRECKDKETENITTTPTENIKDISPPGNGNLTSNIDVIEKVEPLKNATGKNKTNEDNECLMYMCMMCDAHFPSIEDHLEKYHDGEEVVLETENDGEVYDYEDEAMITSKNDDEVYEVPDNEDVVVSNNTVEEQQCLDKDGRAYTRKVVRIDKFWTDENINSTPMTENYVYENGQDPILVVYAILCSPSFKSLRLHQRMHEPVKTKSLDVPVSYSSTGVEDGSGETVPQFICSICNNTYYKEYEEVHMKSHEEENNFNYVRAYKCPYCPKAFKTSVQLAGHKNSHVKPFTCTECNRPFASLYAVRAHMETHKRENNLKFDCWLCGATYARAFALRDHMKSQHADENDKMSNVTSNDMDDVETRNSVSQIKHELVDENEEQTQPEENT